MNEHEHDWQEIPSGRMELETPGGWVEVNNYPSGVRYCRICDVPERALPNAISIGRRSFNPPLDGPREWVIFMAAFFEGMAVR